MFHSVLTPSQNINFHIPTQPKRVTQIIFINPLYHKKIVKTTQCLQKIKNFVGFFVYKKREVKSHAQGEGTAQPRRRFE
jgi:hypothetical protein